jgi:hypothetical protein
MYSRDTGGTLLLLGGAALLVLLLTKSSSKGSKAGSDENATQGGWAQIPTGDPSYYEDLLSFGLPGESGWYDGSNVYGDDGLVYATGSPDGPTPLMPDFGPLVASADLSGPGSSFYYLS